MINIYFDRDNLDSFIRQGEDGNLDYKLCMLMLAKHAKLTLLFPQPTESLVMSEDEQDSCDRFNGWLLDLINLGLCNPQEFNDNNIDFSDDFFATKLSNEFFSPIFLVSSDRLPLTREKFNFLFIEFGNELNGLKSLFDDDYQFLRLNDQKSNIKKTNDWNSVFHPMPCSDIIIWDKFLFSLKDKPFEELENNLLAILNSLASQRKKNINVVIISMWNDRIYDDGILDWVHIQIMNIIPNVNTTFVFHKQTTYTKNNGERLYFEHDRTILTNYSLYTFGSGINILNRVR